MLFASNEPLVSVIIPFLNAAEFIGETIESVIAQSYSNWEIILIDDGSVDESHQIAATFATKNPDKIFIYRHENNANKGAAASRNLGFAKSSGEYITFLDSDDLWLPDKLDKQLHIMNSNPEIDVLCEATLYWNTWYDPNAKDVIIPIGAPADILYDPPKLAAKLYPLRTGDSFCTCALILRRSSFEKMNGFDETFTGTNQLFEDQTFFLKACLTQRVYLSSLCNNIYRQRPNSLMHSIIANGHYNNALFFFLNWLRKYISTNGIEDAEINQLLTKALIPYKYPLLFKIRDYSWKFASNIKKKLKDSIKK